MIHSNFKGRILKSTLIGGCNYNFKVSFQNDSKDAILINTNIIESELSQNYFIQLFKNSERITMRLYPTTDPKNKTSCIKRSLVIIARTILEADTKGEPFIVRTNLQQYLEDIV
ncbi:hypothetical protein BH23THE1_BH23THE1_25000 [soil metagenome]